MKKYEIKLLSKKFYEYYSSNDFKEILLKENRPYLILLIKIQKYDFAIPFRTNIHHKYSFILSKDKDKNSGLDFTKSIIVKNKDYIGNNAYINDEEYIELNTYFPKIIKKYIKFLEKYISIINSDKNYVEKRLFDNSSLKYFEKELLELNLVGIA